MNASEIFILVLMAIIALQMYLIYRVIQSSLETMRACSETSDKAYDLAVQVLDDLAAVSPAPNGKERSFADCWAEATLGPST